ncbi:hypothetical protein [Hephaestia mangrovi]|uniref:hypothetical protein n=1 Tax=Hephaestia mangrovi TaxID=2873268 RepID=UPI001CA64756|nr:hypothetical protein [Hephaestia mangrovi]
MIGHYDWAGGREAMLRFGPAGGPVVVLALPLFEEANRTRAFAVAMLRALAGHGIAALLPDLPGTVESETALEDVTPTDWTEALFAASGDGRCHAAGIRGGCLIAGNIPARSHWFLSPASGEAIVRDLVRARQAADRETGGAFDPVDIDRDGPPIELAGNRVPRALLRALRATEPDAAPPCRVVRLDSDPAPADRHVSGAPLWRRAEPDTDRALAALLAADLADWVRRCEN